MSHCIDNTAVPFFSVHDPAFCNQMPLICIGTACLCWLRILGVLVPTHLEFASLVGSLPTKTDPWWRAYNACQRWNATVFGFQVHQHPTIATLQSMLYSCVNFGGRSDQARMECGFLWVPEPLAVAQKWYILSPSFRRPQKSVLWSCFKNRGLNWPGVASCRL